MTISIVISTKNRLAELTRLFKSLEEQTRLPEEVVVVDADSDPRVQSLVEDRRARYHPLPSSLTQARNHGVRHSTGDIVLFLDDDLILEKDFIREILRPFAEDARIGGVTGNISNHARTEGGFKRVLQILLQLPYDGDGRFRLSGAPTTTCGFPHDLQVEFVPGGLTAWRREVFEEFAFDERLPGLGINEDVDFSYRVSRKWRNVYAANARTAHDRPSLEREGTLDYLMSEYRSSFYLFFKNLPWWNPVHASAFLWHTIGVLIRFFFRRWGRA